MNAILPREGVIYNGPNIVVCEGLADARFLKALLDVRHIESFEIGCPVQGRESSDGKSGVLDYLRAIRAQRTRVANGLRSLGVMIDADTTPAKAFDDARSWLNTAGCEVPDRAFQWTDGASGCRTSVVMIPGMSNDALLAGTLEHLLLELVGTVAPETLSCVEQYVSCLVGQADWSENNKAKMRVRAIIAGRCKTSPAISLAWVWSNDPSIFPVNNPMLDFIGNLFREVV